MRTGERKVYIETFGCQMNKLDSQLVLGALKEHGYARTNDLKQADVILYNTCSVRQHAEDRAYSRAGALGRLKSRNPDLIIGIIGCMAQKDKEAIFRRLPHVDIVCGTRELLRVPELIAELVGRCRQKLLAVAADAPFRFQRDAACRTSPYQAYVSVMRGCDNSCSYCIVPQVRGRAVSREPRDIVEEVKALADAGVVEVTLLGQNVNAYGIDLNGAGVNLASLFEELERVAGIRRIRFLTSHPASMSGEILQAVGGLSKVCECLHMPAQSGSSRVLAKMRRGYTKEQYLERVEKARELIPGVTIVTDFIVGFPGETEEDFRHTASLVEEVRFKNSYIFKYSPRPHTQAAGWEDDVPVVVKKRRNNELLALQHWVSLEDNRKLVGEEFEVLVEGRSKTDADRLCGRTRGEHIAIFAGGSSLAGKSVTVKVTSASSLSLFAEIDREPGAH